jgi:hypothetical protein
VTPAQVLRFRLRASLLDERLPAGSFAQAAYGGIQDSAPRAALLSLHARVDDVQPAAWEHESLVQIWGPRGADYVVPRVDVDVFTVGRMPRDRDQAAALERIADDIHRALDGRTLHTRDVTAALPELGHTVRWAAITGRVHIRWDASRIWCIPVDRPDCDVEAARIELARRFLRWLGPSTVERFAWWAGIEPSEARETWRELGAELVSVEVDGKDRVIFREDEQALANATGVTGVRLLPHGDPFIKTDGPMVVRDAALRLEIFPEPKKRAAFWPVSGAVVVDGEVVGSWARQQRRVSVNPWGKLGDDIRDVIEDEALRFPIPSRAKASVRWTS